jgi:hypothetical protein
MQDYNVKKSLSLHVVLRMYLELPQRGEQTHAIYDHMVSHVSVLHPRLLYRHYDLCFKVHV